ncbi:general transcription factor 3C polypeptide 6-like [Branchiostoma lanceolatum]|uniref:general transcription factor 3C polypeptide 6-like n=1 Tax=Branchiostoma lanceolatum TaxID=7740 RepID=UPI003453AC10
MAQKQHDTEAEEYEEVEDESLVLVELTGIIDTDFLRTGSGQCKFVGIDSEQPVLQMDRYVFTGEYEDTVGTCVLFEEGSQDEDGDTQLTYMCHTAKKLAMTRSFLTSKNDDTDSMSFLREDNPYHRRAMKLASSCRLHVKPDKSASEGTASEVPSSSERPREGAEDVEMIEDIEPLKRVEDSGNRISEETQPEKDGDIFTTETVDVEKEKEMPSDR